jgi:RNA polymerase sigma-70 factor (ECF subfamily)
MDDDLRLIKRYLAGDEYAIEELVMKYQRKIYALAYRMTGNVEDSKDMTQKIFLQAVKNLKGFRRTSAFYTWLYQIAVNACLNHLKEKNRKTVELHESISASRGSTLSTIIENEKGFHVKESLKKLPERQKIAVTLRAYEGLSLKETAEVMKCSEGAVKAHYHNGMKKLRDILKEMGYEIQP